MTLAIRYRAIKEEIARCCIEAGREPESVRILPVSKMVGVEIIEEAVRAGIHEFGENRLESLVAKQKCFPQETWHFVGNIQSRKIPDIVAHAELIHSLYKQEHLALIDKAASACRKVQKVLVEVNISGEENKGGISPHELADFLAASFTYPHLQVAGLMTMAPQGDLSAARACFKALRELQLGVRAQFSDSMAGLALSELSMGMSEDWREAIAEGSTIVRIGRAIFDDRF